MSKRRIRSIVLCVWGLVVTRHATAQSTGKPVTPSSGRSPRTASKPRMTNSEPGTADAPLGVVPKKGFAGATNPSTMRPTTGATRTRQDDSSYWISSLVAGICSGAVSSIACAPLDLVRTRLQVWGGVVGKSSSLGAAVITAVQPRPAPTIVQIFRDIIQRDGIQGCFRGLTATLLTVPAFWGVYFPLYDDFKWRWRRRFPEANTAVIHMGSAVSAGAIADILCNPMFVVRTRLQTEAVHNLLREVSDPSSVVHTKSSTIAQTVQQLYAEGGLRTFWRGMSANLLGLSHVAVQFPVYEQLKASLRQRRQHLLSASNNDPTENTVLELLFASGLSKMAASLLTYPHETIRSRMMDARTAQTVSFIDTCRRMYAAEGVLGFYAGLSVSLIRVIPNTMLTFLVYETALRMVQKRLLPDNCERA